MGGREGRRGKEREGGRGERDMEVSVRLFGTQYDSHSSVIFSHSLYRGNDQTATAAS